MYLDQLATVSMEDLTMEAAWVGVNYFQPPTVPILHVRPNPVTPILLVRVLIVVLTIVSTVSLLLAWVLECVFVIPMPPFNPIVSLPFLQLYSVLFLFPWSWEVTW